MANDDDDLVPLLPAFVQAPSHQRRADALVLELRQNRHWCKSKGRNDSGFRDDRQVAEEDVADDLTGFFGDQGEPDEPAVPEGIHEPGFVILAKGESVDVADGLVVSAGFWPDVAFAHGTSSSTSNAPVATVIALPPRNARSLVTRTSTTPPLADAG